MRVPAVHLVDATYELFRAWFGAPPRSAPDGREVGAVRALAATLLVLIRDEGATHVGCATDHVIRSFRNDLWPGYKTEEGMPPELGAQFQLAEDVMSAMGLVVWPMIEHEADDALATAAARYAPDADRVVICTVDKDLAQCVSGDHVIMCDRRRKTEMDEAGVREKFGVGPDQIADYLALVGDTADGYPGIPGFGAKTAAAVLRTFGALESIPDDPSTWPASVRGAPRLASTLAAARRDAGLFKVLATLRRDAPLRESLEDLAWRGPKPELEALTLELGFPEIASRTRQLVEGRRSATIGG